MTRARVAARLAGLAALCAACDRAEPAPEPSPAAPRAPSAALADGARPWLADVTAASGIDFVHDAGRTEEKHLPETMGGGAALVDANGDGVLDVYCVQSGPLPIGAAATERAAGAANRLYLGLGGGRFADATAAARDGAHRGYGMGVAAGDADQDGDVDLYVTNLGPDAFLKGAGDGSFDDATAAAGLGDARWTAGALFLDADQDGDLDLYVTGYLDYDLANPEWCGDRRPGWRSYCHPDHYDGIADRYWRNDGAGRFVDATADAGLADNLGKGLGVIGCDLDADGDLELYVANDGTENRLWENRGDGTFADATLRSGTGVDKSGATQAGMGLAAADADGDLDLDLFVTNFDDESNALYRNDGSLLFRDATIAFGLEAESRMPVGFGCVWEDLDLDGDVDLAVANGHIIDNIALYHDGKTWAQRAQLFVCEQGRYRLGAAEAGDLARDPLVGRGLYAGDLDADGDPDLLLTQCGGPALVLRNDAPRAPGRVVRDLPPGTRVEAELADGRRVVRQLGLAISYFGLGEEAVWLPPDARSVRARAPGGEWVDL